MDKIKSTITKVLATWVGIGFALIAIGSTGIVDIPDQWLELFSQGLADKIQAIVDILFEAVGDIIVVAQIIRGIFAAKDTSQVKVLDAKDIKAFKFSPFKVI